MRKEKWVFNQVTYNGLYFNGRVDWAWETETAPVQRPSEVNSKYIFNSEKEGNESGLLERFPNILNKYKLVEVSGTFYKPIAMRSIFEPNIPKIYLGEKNEYCGICGQNILVNEPYIIWSTRKKICLHCAMMEATNINNTYNKLPTKLKDEWNRNGKKEFEKKCTDFI